MEKSVQDLIAYLPSLTQVVAGWETLDANELARPEVTLATHNFYGGEDWRKRTRAAIQANFPKSDRRIFPIATSRAIASTGFLIKDSKVIEQWRRTARDIAAVEMELAGVYQASRRRGV